MRTITDVYGKYSIEIWCLVWLSDMYKLWVTELYKLHSFIDIILALVVGHLSSKIAMFFISKASGIQIYYLNEVVQSRKNISLQMFTFPRHTCFINPDPFILNAFQNSELNPSVHRTTTPVPSNKPRHF